MHIHSENTEALIYALAASIKKDPASLEGWNCMHISYDEASVQNNCTDILEQFKSAHTDTDCNVIQCKQGDVFFISRSLQRIQLHVLADEYIQLASIEEHHVTEYAMYDLYNDWKFALDLLNNKICEYKISETNNTLYSFGEISSLLEVFAEAKRNRKVRLPLHVMVVEDDSLTRRIVSNAFKENYALITAENAQEAISNYLIYAPDIVFLDIGLPDTSGFDVLHQIVATDKDAYVVMFSSNSYLENITSALLQGASGFVSKPFKKEKMRHYIQDSAMHHNKNCA